MKSASPEMVALLAGNQFRMADLFTITLVNGDEAYFTSWDIDLVYGGNIYRSNILLIERDSLSWETGVTVSSMKVNITANGGSIVFGQPFLSLAHNGGLDGARVTLNRTFMATPGDTSAGVIPLFDGLVQEVDVTRNTATLTVDTDIVLLNIQMPRNLYQPGCQHTLYDAGCKLLKPSYGVGGAVTAGSTTSLINKNLTQTTGYFDQGTIVFTSGANLGVSQTVLSYVSGQIYTIPPLRSLPETGDEFMVYPGCDKQQSTCTNKFSNLANFKAFPYIPVSETAA